MMKEADYMFYYKIDENKVYKKYYNMFIYFNSEMIEGFEYDEFEGNYISIHISNLCRNDNIFYMGLCFNINKSFNEFKKYYEYLNKDLEKRFK